MELVINTSEPLNELEKRMLSLLLWNGEEIAPNAPEAKPVAKKAAAKKATPAPEPMAEEPVEVEEEPVGEEVDDGVSDEDLLALAVKKATEMVASGDAAQVREALDAAGASRVRELNKDNVREFFKALS